MEAGTYVENPLCTIRRTRRLKRIITRQSAVLLVLQIVLISAFQIGNSNAFLASVNHLRFVRGAKELLSASEDTDAHLWDIETTEIIQTYGKG